MAERKIHLSTAQQLEFISVSESITDDELEFYYRDCRLMFSI